MTNGLEKAKKLTEVIERVKAATGPDREIDATIYETLGYEVIRLPERRRARGWAYLVDGRWNSMGHLSGSIDAIVALIERNGWRLYTIDASIEGRYSVMLAGPKRLHWSEELQSGVTIPDYSGASHSDLCLALCLAFLAAQSIDTGGGEA